MSHSSTDEKPAGAPAVLIAGPTAVGKSAAALALAERLNGEIVNADAMQVYRDLRIVTARPGAADAARAPHHLYGVQDGAAAFSAGRWARAAGAIIAQIRARGAVPIIVGGTGLYFRVLTDGLSPIPEIPPDIRARAAARRTALGPEAFRDEVVARDPGLAHLPVGDAQRLMRGWEVYEATGRALSAFQGEARVRVLEGAAANIVLAPPREELYRRCDRRAAAMLEAGAVEEVRLLAARALDPGLPVMKALGVPELTRYLTGDLDREGALGALQQATRRFAKRQLTWFRNQTPDWPRVATPDEAVARVLATAR